MGNTIIITDAIDNLGVLLADIARLTAEAEQIKDALRDMATASGDAPKEFAGEMYQATVVQADRKSVDYKAMLAELKIAADVVAKFSRITPSFSVKVTARKA